ncbi:RTA1-domain-containing protein [Thermothelomyces heterothallicus CBS 203.75]
MAGDEGQAFEGGFTLYRYNPSLAANAIFVFLFGAASIAHLVYLVRKKTWYFIPFVIGCLFEAVGYVGRIAAAQEAPDFTLTPYIVQNLLILLGPALLAASIYMILARLIRLLGAEEYALVRTRWMTKIFVAGDVLSFLAQGAGGGFLAKAKTKEDQERGENIILAGLGIQIIFFGFFMTTTVIFHVRIARNPTPPSLSAAAGPWRRLVAVLYASSVLIMVRSVFRMVEFGMGYDSVLMSSEAYLLGLDGALMFAAAAALLWCHPSRVLRHGRDAGGPALLLLTSVGSGRGGDTTDDGFGMLPVHHPRTTPGRSDGGGIAKQGYDEYEVPSPGRPRYTSSQNRYVNRG